MTSATPPRSGRMLAADRERARRDDALGRDHADPRRDRTATTGDVASAPPGSRTAARSEREYCVVELRRPRAVLARQHAAQRHEARARRDLDRHRRAGERRARRRSRRARRAARAAGSRASCRRRRASRSRPAARRGRRELRRDLGRERGGSRAAGRRARRRGRSSRRRRGGRRCARTSPGVPGAVAVGRAAAREHRHLALARARRAA